jgi:hypothetical protein
MNLQEAIASWREDQAGFEAAGLFARSVKAVLPPEFRRNFDAVLAMDAQPGLSTDPNSGIPWFLTNFMDPQTYKVLFAKNKGASILGEQKRGDWTSKTTTFPIVEQTGEVTSYGDYNEGGHTGANANWPVRQSYLFQTTKEIGDLELDTAGAARLNWVAEIDEAVALALNKAQNTTYFFGLRGLQNYGILNDPHLSASLTPAPKAYGNNQWITNGVITATANEVYTDIQTMFTQLVIQSAGLIELDAKVKLCVSPASVMALTAANSFGVSLKLLLKDNFPNLTIESAVQYGAQTATNPQGVVGGNFAQLIADDVEGQKTGFCGFNEKMRAHPMVRALSSYKQKFTGGTWGAVYRTTITVSSMIGI